MSAPSMDATYGAMYIGLLFATFFQGVLSVQAYLYFAKFPRDPLKTKILVISVWLADLLHLVLISRAGYHYFITEWGNTPALMYSTEELDLHTSILGIATILCQGFFLYRIWILSHHNLYLVLPLTAGCLTTFVLDIVIAIQVSNVPLVSSFSHFKPEGVEAIAISSIGAGVDVIIALVLCFYLKQGQTNHSLSLVSRIIEYTVATGLATSTFAIGCLIAYLIRPDTFIFIAMYFSMGRMYTNALLASLNARRHLRKENQPSSFMQASVPGNISFGNGTTQQSIFDTKTHGIDGNISFGQADESGKHIELHNTRPTFPDV
ncbi:hypothetical protein BDQ12DRAFT_687799 [Crucibulum laeve]|uniref:DUF6534 domain-containing protein n=1 Tax=Crucibulum laeve TaxID=68775 RepID=A0A5C3LUD1_9AGAR|nr:hypothetical protein BDQ12DRAFT_687799 [Crucibulum laeve]